MNCLKISVLSKLTMEQGNLLSETAQVHTVEEQFAREKNRDIASFNTDNEFNRAINEENIDFNIPGLPHSAVTQSHGFNVQNFDSEDREPPHRHAHQSDLQQHRQFNPFSKESQDFFKAAGNTEMCELVDVNPKHSAKYVCRTGMSALSTARAGTSCEMERRRTRNSSSTLLTSFRFLITTSRKGDPTGTDTRRSTEITSTSSRIRSRRNARREISWYSRPVHP